MSHPWRVHNEAATHELRGQHRAKAPDWKILNFSDQIDKKLAVRVGSAYVPPDHVAPPARPPECCVTNSVSLQYSMCPATGQWY